MRFPNQVHSKSIRTLACLSACISLSSSLSLAIRMDNGDKRQHNDGAFGWWWGNEEKSKRGASRDGKSTSGSGSNSNRSGEKVNDGLQGLVEMFENMQLKADDDDTDIKYDNKENYPYMKFKAENNNGNGKTDDNVNYGNINAVKYGNIGAVGNFQPKVQVPRKMSSVEDILLDTPDKISISEFQKAEQDLKDEQNLKDGDWVMEDYFNDTSRPDVSKYEEEKHPENVGKSKNKYVQNSWEKKFLEDSESECFGESMENKPEYCNFAQNQPGYFRHPNVKHQLRQEIVSIPNVLASKQSLSLMQQPSIKKPITQKQKNDLLDSDSAEKSGEMEDWDVNRNPGDSQHIDAGKKAPAERKIPIIVESNMDSASEESHERIHFNDPEVNNFLKEVRNEQNQGIKNEEMQNPNEAFKNDFNMVKEVRNEQVKQFNEVDRLNQGLRNALENFTVSTPLTILDFMHQQQLQQQQMLREQQRLEIQKLEPVKIEKLEGFQYEEILKKRRELKQGGKLLRAHKWEEEIGEIDDIVGPKKLEKVWTAEREIVGMLLEELELKRQFEKEVGEIDAEMIKMGKTVEYPLNTNSNSNTVEQSGQSQMGQIDQIQPRQMGNNMKQQMGNTMQNTMHQPSPTKLTREDFIKSFKANHIAKKRDLPLLLRGLDDKESSFVKAGFLSFKNNRTFVVKYGSNPTAVANAFFDYHAESVLKDGVQLPPLPELLNDNEVNDNDVNNDINIQSDINHNRQTSSNEHPNHLDPNTGKIIMRGVSLTKNLEDVLNLRKEIVARAKKTAIDRAVFLGKLRERTEETRSKWENEEKLKLENEEKLKLENEERIERERQMELKALAAQKQMAQESILGRIEREEDESIRWQLIEDARWESIPEELIQRALKIAENREQIGSMIQRTMIQREEEKKGEMGKESKGEDEAEKDEKEGKKKRKRGGRKRKCKFF